MARKKKKAGEPPGVPAARFRPGPACLAATLCVLFLLHVAVFGWRVMSAERQLSADSFNYATIARNLSEGRGFVQSAPGFNQPAFWGDQFSPDFPPQVRSSHSILYPLLIFAAAETSGLPHGDAAFLIGALAYFAVLALVFLLALRLWGAGAGLLAVAAIAVSPPGVDWLKTDWLFTWAWTEPVATALLLGMLILLAKNPGGRAFFAAGILTGLAYAQRSGMLPLAGIGVLAALLCAGGGRWRMLGLFLAAAAAAASLRHLVGEGTVYSTYAPTIWSVDMLLSQYFSAMGAALLIVGALAAAVLWRAAPAKKSRKQMKLRVREASGEILLFAWIAGYSAFILVVASIINFTPANDDRILYPLKIAVMTLGAGLTWRLLPIGRWRTLLAAGVFSLAMAGESPATGKFWRRSGMFPTGGESRSQRCCAGPTKIFRPGIL